MKVFLDCVGCRLNQAEIEKMARQFRAEGHEIVADTREADLAVINTCTVTNQAAADSRHKVHQATRNGGGNIVLTGCWSTMEPEQAKLLVGEGKIIPNNQKEQLVNDILGISDIDIDELERQPIPGARRRTRAFIKVQDGCENHCTFCITTIARGEGQSRNIAEVIKDIKASVLGGVKEVVLTGVHLGSWGNDLGGGKLRLKDLIKAILNEVDIKRMRLSSLEPWDMDDQFWDLWRDARLCRHLHLPLQSGSASVLRRMARKTTPIEYANLVMAARDKISEVAITTDMICGFPGESDKEFDETLAFVKEMNFAGGHVFTYSARPGTAAAKMGEQIPNVIRKGRSNQLRTLLEKSKDAFAENFIGKKMEVLWEKGTATGDGWLMEGLSDNYLHIQTISKTNLWNEINKVKINSNKRGKLTSDLVRKDKDE